MSENYIGIRFSTPRRLQDSPFLTFDEATVLRNAAATDVTSFGAKGDGITNDTQAIQDAINANSVVYFPPGTYVTTSPLLLSSNQCLSGDGATINATLTGNAITISGKSNVCIEGLQINHKLTASAAYSSLNGIYAVNSTNVYIRNCRVFQLNGFVSAIGVHFDNGTSRCLVIGCTFGITDPLYSPATIQNPPYQQHCVFCNGGSSYITISNNIMKYCGTGVGIQTVNAVDVTDIIVSNNDVSEMGHYGMFNYQLSALPIRIVYIGNSIRNVYGTYYNSAVNALSHGAGIYNQSGIKVAVIGNLITNTCILTDNETLAPAGISSLLTSNYMIISGNMITNSNRYGIIPDGRNITVTGNTVIDSVKSSIYIRDLLYGTITGNTIENTGSFISLGNRGIFSLGVTPANFVSFSGNTIRNLGIGILLQNANNFTVSGNIIQSDSATVSTGSAITTNTNCTQGNISGNSIAANGGFGIRNLGDYINCVGNVINGTAANQAINNGSLVNNNYGTNITDTANAVNATGVVTIASANDIILPYCINESLFINITGTTQINTIALPLYKRSNMVIHIVGPVGLVLANNTAGTGLRLLNSSAANVTIATANVEVISYRCNGVQWVQF